MNVKMAIPVIWILTGAVLFELLNACSGPLRVLWRS